VILRYTVINLTTPFDADRKTNQRPRATAAPDEINVMPDDDLWRFAAPIRPQLSAAVHRRFHEAIELSIKSMTELMFGICDISDIDSQANMGAELPHQIEKFQGELLRMQQEVAGAGNRIQPLIAELELVHRRLQSELTKSLSVIPQEQRKINLASTDLLAASIETSLIQLSLIRARAHQSLYGFKTTSSSKHDLSRALSSAYNKATREARRMKDEAATLDRQIHEYEALLGLVDEGGGYKQVIEDWTRVKQDTEECRRDLRRLGWTGD